MVNAVGSMAEMREMTFGIFGKRRGKLSGNDGLGSSCFEGSRRAARDLAICKSRKRNILKYGLRHVCCC